MQLMTLAIFVLLGVMLGGSAVFIMLHRAHRQAMKDLGDKMASLERGLAQRDRDETPLPESRRAAPASALLPASPTQVQEEPQATDPALGPAFIPLPRLAPGQVPGQPAPPRAAPSHAAHATAPAVAPNQAGLAYAQGPDQAPQALVPPGTPAAAFAATAQMPAFHNAPAAGTGNQRIANATTRTAPSPSAVAYPSQPAGSRLPATAARPLHAPSMPSGGLVAPPIPGLTPPEENSLPRPPPSLQAADAAVIPVSFGGLPSLPPAAPLPPLPPLPAGIPARRSMTAATAPTALPNTYPATLPQGHAVLSTARPAEPTTLVENVQRANESGLGRLLQDSRARMDPTLHSSPAPARRDEHPVVAEPAFTRPRRPVRPEDEVTQLDPLEPDLLARLQGTPEIVPPLVQPVESSGPKRVFEEPALPERVAANGEIVRGQEARTRVAEIESNSEPHATSDAWVWASPPELDRVLGEFTRNLDDPAGATRRITNSAAPAWPPLPKKG